MKKPTLVRAMQGREVTHAKPTPMRAMWGERSDKCLMLLVMFSPGLPCVSGSETINMVYPVFLLIV